MFVVSRVNKQIDSDLLPCFQEPFSGMLCLPCRAWSKWMAAENDAFIHCKERAGVRKMKWPVIVSGSQHLQLLLVELISPEKKEFCYSSKTEI